MKTDRGSVSTPIAVRRRAGSVRTLLLSSTGPNWTRHPIATLSGAYMEIKLKMSFRSSFDQQRLYLFRGGVLHMRQNMRINVERERHAGMSQLFADHFWGDPRNQ